jgi:TRAP-type C4-dicarboxylate transport system permease small subunit
MKHWREAADIGIRGRISIAGPKAAFGAEFPGAELRGAEIRDAEIMAVFVHTITALSRFFGGVAAAMVVTSLVLVGDMAVMEFAYGIPAPWPSEIVSYLVISVIFLGTPYVFATGRHVSFALPSRRANSALGRMQHALTAILSFGFAALLFILGLALIAEAAHEGWHSDDVAWMALWIPYLSLPLGATLLALQCLAEVMVAVSGTDGDSSPDAVGAMDAEGFPD